MLRFLMIFLFPVAVMACSDSSGNHGDLQRAILLYQAGWQGNDAALLEAMELLSGMHVSKNAQPLVRAYYGSASIARARMVPDWRKRQWLQRGAAELDGAVKTAPDDVEVRLLRATSFAILPRLAGKMETVRADFEWLVERAESGGQRTEVGGSRVESGEGEELRWAGGEWEQEKLGRVAKSKGGLSEGCRQAIYYYAGSSAMRERDPRAIGWLEAAMKIGEDGEIAMDRLQRALQLARGHFVSQDAPYDR
jgi:hypothetical protein